MEAISGPQDDPGDRCSPRHPPETSELVEAAAPERQQRAIHKGQEDQGKGEGGRN